MPQASPRGTFLVVADGLRAGMRSGEITDRLPSEAQLMRTHNVGRSTVRRALGVLAAEGLVESVPGAGWRMRGEERHRPLRDRLTELIETDSLEVGGRFPSEAALCERLGASRTAVRRALAQLEGEGVLKAAHGKGRVVSALPKGSS